MTDAENIKVPQLVDHLFRHESGKLVAILTRIFGISQLELAEDIVQETLLDALDKWSTRSIPDNPAGWLMQVAKRKTINELNRRQMMQRHEPEIAREQGTQFARIEEYFEDEVITDSQLRMIFVCCHPKLPIESQIALTLKSLCGFSVKEIAHSLLTTVSNINKRLYRARSRFREEGFTLEIPPPAELEDRLNAVCLSLYLLFNQGYQSSESEHLIRRDLCLEAISLCTLLVEAFPGESRIPALLSLMYLHAARFEARLDVDGAIVLLEDQDRSLWDKRLISAGLRYLQQASHGDHLTEYHLEAGIAATHCLAPNMDQTDWHRIAAQYDLLRQIKPTPIVDFNRAIVSYWTKGPTFALESLLKLQVSGHLQKYHLLPAGIGVMYNKLGQFEEARASFMEAKALTNSVQQRILLDRRIRECEDSLT